MKKELKLFLIATVVCFATTAAIYAKKIQIQEPDWVLYWRELYPDNKYIAQRGASTASAAEAKNEAKDRIAEYLEAGISSETVTNRSSSTVMDGKAHVKSSVSNSKTVKVSVDVTVNGLEYTDPWYNKKEKTWYCLAYVSREKAWEVYGPIVEAAKEKFCTLYNIAEKEPEPISRCSLYATAKGNSQDFIDSLYFANLIYPEAAAKYNSTRNDIAGIPAKVKDILLDSSLKLDIEGDSNSSIYSSILDVFSGFGMLVQEQKSKYIVKTVVNDNSQSYMMGKREIISVYPSISLKMINEHGNSVYSFSYKTDEKTTNFDIEHARTGALQKFSPQMKEKLKEDFARYIGFDEFELLFY